jgi:DNA helicase-2/ATP-dependent DNA helicase PcrA
MEESPFGRQEEIFSSRSVDTILEGLNPEQEEAVTYGEGPLLVVAGAGTGKTRVITRRIAYLIATHRARPEEIVALTFTEKAAAEMEDRVDRLVPYGYVDVWIHTFHAFGDRVLREHAVHLGLPPDPPLLTTPEQKVFLREHLFDLPLSLLRPLSNPTKYVDPLIRLFSRAKDEDIAPSEYLAYAEELEQRSQASPNDEDLAEESALQKEIAIAYNGYQKLLSEEGRIDFGDQVALVLKLFREHPTVLREYQKRIRYILVDEFQDTNYAQFELLELLAGQHRNLTVVGDDDQSIYKFRGAAISNILGFNREYPEAHQVVLTRNYRSSQVILDTAYRLIRHNDPDRLEVREQIDKRLRAEQSEGPPVLHHYVDTLTSEADLVAHTIQEGVEAGRFSCSDVAILVRINNTAEPFLRALNMKGIPWHFSGNQGLFDRPEVRLLICFLRAITNLYDTVSLYYLAQSDVYQFKPRDLVRCLNVAGRTNRPLHDVLRYPDQFPDLADLSEESTATAARISQDLDHYIDLSQECPTGEVLYQFLVEKGVLRRLTENPSVANEEKVKNIARFFEVVRSWSRELSIDRAPHFVDHLDELRLAGENPPVAETDVEIDAVNVLTVHKAKGLEFPVVFIVGMVAGLFPIRRRGAPLELPDELIREELPSGDFHLQEERRLFYVAMTRAKRELHLTSAQDYGGARPRKLSQFVLEALDLPKGEAMARSTPAVKLIQHHAPAVPVQAGHRAPIDDQEIITLSYRQMDDYLTCPLKYKFIHILRIPILPHHAVVYGKAIHDAVQEYHRRKLTGIPITLEELIDTFHRSWINEGFIHRQHEDQRLQAGRQALERFYQTQEASGIIPRYVEKEFSFVVDRSKVIGRWDRVDEANGEVVIIDFKSSEIRRQKEADTRARKSEQMGLYALAYQRTYGRIPDRVELHFLDSGLVGTATKNEEDLEEVISKIRTVTEGLRAREYPSNPQYRACDYCPYRVICPRHAGCAG